MPLSQSVIGSVIVPVITSIFGGDESSPTARIGWTDGILCDPGILGPERLSSPQFIDNVPSWFAGLNWSITSDGTTDFGSYAECNGTGGVLSALMSDGIDIGDTFDIEIVTRDGVYSGAGLQVELGAGIVGTITSDGTHPFTVTTISSTPTIVINEVTPGDFTGKVQSVSVQQHVFGGNYIVLASSTIAFTDHAGATFTKNDGQPSEEVLAATSSTVSPARLIVYDTPAWSVALIAGDTVTFKYDADLGNYLDPNSDPINEPLESQELSITNCLGKAQIQPRIVSNTFGPLLSASGIWAGWGTFNEGDTTIVTNGDSRTFTMATTGRAFMSNSFSVVAGTEYYCRIKTSASSGSIASNWFRWLGAIDSGVRSYTGNLPSGEYAIIFVASSTVTADLRLGLNTTSPATGSGTITYDGVQFGETSLAGVPDDFIFRSMSGARDTVLANTWDSGTGLVTDIVGANIITDPVNSEIDLQKVVAVMADSFGNETREFPQLLREAHYADWALYQNAVAGRTLAASESEIPSLLAGNNVTSAMRVDNLVPTLTSKMLVVGGGVNDMFIDTTDAQLRVIAQSIIDYCKTNSVKCVFLTIPPYGNHTSHTASRETETLSYNAWLLTKADDDVSIYDMFSDLATPATFNLDAAYDSGDGLHPNTTGSQLIADGIEPLVIAFQN